LTPTVKEVSSQLFSHELAVDLQDLQQTADIKPTIPTPYVAVGFKATVDSISHHWFIISADLVNQLVAWMLISDPEPEVGEEQLEALQEIFNQMFGQIQMTMDAAGKKIEFADITTELVTADWQADLADALLPLANATGQVVVEDGVYPFQIFSQCEFESRAVPDPVPAAAPAATPPQTEAHEPILSPMPDPMPPADPVAVSQVDFGSFGSDQTGGNGEPRNINMLMDVELLVMAELGRKTMVVKDILKLGKGSVVELNKAAGEPLDLYVNGTKLAEGEVVVVEDHFGIRITQLATPKDRIKSLG